jgi:hypothetical protein
MASKATQLNIKLDKLILDINNPRFAELYSGSKKEDDLIEYLLYTEAAEEVAARIVKVGEFYPDRPLWVIKQGKDYLVKDGNRRCAAAKALQMPGKYKLGFTKTLLTELPVLLYQNEDDVNERIIEEHAGSLFRNWERIAKALEVLKLAETGRWSEAQDLDSKPGDLIKLATFYREAVKISGDDLRMLLRRGRGKTGGKTIIFERLFRDAKLCGYSFKNSPSFKVDINDITKFNSYISSIVKYLKVHPETTTKIIDNDKKFLKKLEVYGFFAYGKTSGTGTTTGGTGTTTDGTGTTTGGTGTTTTGATGSTSGTSGSSTKTGTGSTSSSTSTGTSDAIDSPSSVRGSIKKFPSIKRKKLPSGLKDRIDEYYSLNPINQTNAKIAMGRVTFECILKYVVENTKFNGRTTMHKSGHFGPVYRSAFSDFTLMKTKFTELIVSKGERGAFLAFDLDKMHTIVHNYKVNGLSSDAISISQNLTGLIDFMLQDEADLLSSLDITKL